MLQSFTVVDPCEDCPHMRSFSEDRGEYWGTPCYENYTECDLDLDPEDEECPNHMEDE